MFHCGIIYQDHSYSQLREQLELHEDVRIYLEQDYEQINVPMLHFGESDPADIIHDFQRVRFQNRVRGTSVPTGVDDEESFRTVGKSVTWCSFRNTENVAGEGAH